MELILTLEAVRHDYLENLYTLFPIDFFYPHATVNQASYGKFCAMFRKIEDTIISLNHQWWDKFFVLRYRLSKITSRGLRITDVPFSHQSGKQNGNTSLIFAHKSGLILLLSKERIKSKRWRKRLRHTSAPLEPRSTISPLPSKKSWRKKNKKDEDLLIKVKLNKIRRDVDDYTSSKVFNWKPKIAPTYRPYSIPYIRLVGKPHCIHTTTQTPKPLWTHSY